MRRRLAAVFQDAPECGEARAMEAELLLGERDFSGAALTELHAEEPLTEVAVGMQPATSGVGTIHAGMYVKLTWARI